MQIESGKIECLCGGGVPFEKMPSLKALRPFSDAAVGFLSALSRELMADKAACVYPDIAAFAYFCRKSNLEREKTKYSDCLENRIGRGLTFHIAPSNVPTIFAYSMVAGLLGGNACIVRVSEKSFPQVNIICDAIKKVFQSEEHDILKEYIAIIRYERGNDITAYFSAMCNVRIIWGGDNTISEIRKSQVPPRAFDITFADRYSFCAIHARSYIEMFDPIKTAQDFYNDVYPYDQNACSSPRLIVWIGSKEDIAKAKRLFWDAIHDYAQQRYVLEPVLAVEKLMTVCRCAIDLEKARYEKMADNLVSRIGIGKLTGDVLRCVCPGGSFIEYDDVDLNALAGIANDKFQTMSYIGFNPEELRDWVFKNGLSGIDRIVPVGKTADFSLVWDGWDLIRSLSRVCEFS